MEGYVRNSSRTWRHALKRSIAPGQKIDLDILYSEYGERHRIEEGKPFVDWLRNVKLKDASTWEISFREPFHIEEDENADIIEDKGASEIVEIDSENKSLQQQEKPDNINPFVETVIESMDVVHFSIREAKEELPKIMDIKLLKRALNAAKTQAGKDTLTNMLRKRIKELEVSSRR